MGLRWLKVAMFFSWTGGVVLIFGMSCMWLWTSLCQNKQNQTLVYWHLCDIIKDSRDHLFLFSMSISVTYHWSLELKCSTVLQWPSCHRELEISIICDILVKSINNDKKGQITASVTLITINIYTKNDEMAYQNSTLSTSIKNAIYVIGNTLYTQVILSICGIYSFRYRDKQESRKKTYNMLIYSYKNQDVAPLKMSKWCTINIWDLDDNGPWRKKMMLFKWERLFKKCWDEDWWQGQIAGCVLFLVMESNRMWINNSLIITLSHWGIGELGEGAETMPPGGLWG